MSTAQPGGLRITWDNVIYLWQPNFSRAPIWELFGFGIAHGAMVDDFISGK